MLGFVQILESSINPERFTSKAWRNLCSNSQWYLGQFCQWVWRLYSKDR